MSGRNTVYTVSQVNQHIKGLLFKDMYSAGFYPFPTLEEFWAYWSRYVYINRFQNPPKPIYEKLLSLIREKDYFVLTTNVDHCFQKAGFDKKRIFNLRHRSHW